MRARGRSHRARLSGYDIKREEPPIKELYRLPFDQFQRYRLAAEAVPLLEGDGPRLAALEAGGRPPTLELFLPEHQITYVDLAPAPGCVMARGAELPFADRSFGLVISLDTLEHLPGSERERFICELCRVSSNSVILGAPFFSEAVKSADRAVFEFIRSHAGYEHEFLKEHLELELPDLMNTLTTLAGQGLDVQVLPSGRLDRWLLMMVAYYTLDADPALKDSLPRFMEAYNRAFYDFDKAEPAYRHLLVGARAGIGDRWSKLAGLASGEAAEKADFRALALVLELARTLALKQKDQQREALIAELVQKDEELTALTEEAVALREFMRKVKSLPLYRLYEKILKPRRPQ